MIVTLRGSGVIVSGAAPAAAARPWFIFGANAVGTSTTTRFLYPGFDDSLAQTTVVQFAAPAPGTLQNLFIRHNTGAGNGNDIVYTVRVNGVPTLLAVTLASTGLQASNLINTAPVVQGDLVGVAVTKALAIGSSPGDVLASLELAA